MFARLGPWCHDRRKLVLILWFVGLIAVNVVAGAMGTKNSDAFGLPDVESGRGVELLEEEFGGVGAGVSGTIVFRAEKGVADPSVKPAIEALLAKVADNPDVKFLQSPFTADGAFQVATTGPEAGKIAFATVEFPEDTAITDMTKVGDAIAEDAEAIDGVQVELGGQVFAAFEPPQTEVIGLAFAIVILIVAFGSVLAMGLPVAIALFGIGVGIAIMTLLSHVLSVPEFAPFIGIMIGLGVGIDYALLIVTRHREQLHLGHTPREAVEIAMDTAGRSVVFAGTTVVISLLGMLAMGVSFVQGLAVSAAVVVAMTVLASVTLLPALLGFAGEGIERTHYRGLIAAGLVAVGLIGLGLKIQPLLVGLPLAVVILIAGTFIPTLKREFVHRPPKPLRETAAYRWSRVIQHRPWTAAVAASLVLLVLALPVLGLRLGFSDESNYAEETTTRKAYDLLSAGFGKGFNGPLILATRLSEDDDRSVLGAVTQSLAYTPGVAFASPAILNDPVNPTAALWRVIPTSGPQDEATSDLVNRIRDDVLAPAEASLGTQINVTGFTAGNIDFASYLGSRLPYFFVAVLLLSFLLLMVVFRSILVPLKAVVMNLLSLAGAYGIVVAIFQWGWLGDITGVQAAPIEPWVPMMLFAIVFGLSMDYEVFLLSRVREEWHRTGDSRESVADGLAATAKVITAAAAIMVVVFGSFLLEGDRVTKLMGTGLAMAILLDATIVRMVLVPATMELLGDRNWWLPKWLDKVLPNIDVEGHIEAAHAPVDPEDRKPALVD